MLKDEYLWVEKYRPKTIDECILPNHLKAEFNSYVNAGEFPRLLLYGGPGVGKTTVAKALCTQLGYDWYFKNASMEGNIDTLRTEIKNYASTVSLTGDRKCVILDEADHLSKATQPALRGFLEEHSHTGFILTCNYLNNIIQPLHSRFACVEFRIDPESKPQLMGQMLKRVFYILDTEGVEYDKAVVAEFIKKYFPDNRRILNELQRYAKQGKIDTGILTALASGDLNALIAVLKTKKYKDVQKWVVENVGNDSRELLTEIYKSMYDYVKPESIPQLVVMISEYQYKMAFSANEEITLMACLTEMMANVEFK